MTDTPLVRYHDLPSGVTLHTLDWRPSGDLITPARPWLVTHGLASNARLWDGAARRMCAMGHRVVAVDQRGHGLSSKPAGDYDIATCAEDLADLIGVLELDRPAVAGQSWGGNVVLELGSSHPESVESICCVDGGFIDLASRFPQWDQAKQALSPPHLEGTPVGAMRERLEHFAADWPPEGRAGTMANFEVRRDGTIAPWLTFERHLLVLRGLWEHRPFDIFGEMEVPVLLIAADDGNHTWDKTPEVTRALDLLPVGRAEWFTPAHHDVHAQKPDLVASLLHEATTDPHFFTDLSPRKG